MEYETFTIYLASTSKIKKDAVYYSLKHVFQKLYNKSIIQNINEMNEDNVVYVLLVIVGEKIHTNIRSEPASGKETVSGSKLRAYDMSKKYPNEWCVGVETGIIECYNYFNKTDTYKGTIPHEMIDNPSALEYLKKFKEEGSYQLDLDMQCKKEENLLGINDLSYTDSYNVTSVTIVSPLNQSITFLSNGVPMPFTSYRMEEYDYLYHELERDGLDDIEKCMSSSLSNRTMSIVDPLMKSFAYLFKLPTYNFLHQVQMFWTDERRKRYFNNTKKNVPNYATFTSALDILKTPNEYWSFLVN